ncbi:MAG: hypothetical protein ABEJ83_03445 [Candidatus Nanohaloarchaea archaeon]
MENKYAIGGIVALLIIGFVVIGYSNSQPELISGQATVSTTGGDVSPQDNPSLGQTDVDSDDDGLTDTKEEEIGTNPSNSDSDSDGLSDQVEYEERDTNPQDTDSDNDGLNDGEEVNSYGTDPVNQDTDGDSLNDGREVNSLDSSPVQFDTDSDGLSDNQEIEEGTEVRDADTDDDGLNDGAEIETGADPLEPNTDGDEIRMDGIDEFPLRDAKIVVTSHLINIHSSCDYLSSCDPRLAVTTAGERVGGCRTQTNDYCQDQNPVNVNFPLTIDAPDSKREHEVTFWVYENNPDGGYAVDINGDTADENTASLTYTLGSSSTDTITFDGRDDGAGDTDATLEVSLGTTFN